MDVWIPYAVRQHCRDAVEQWAELEGKSALMSDDLARQYAPAPRALDWKLTLALVGKLLAWAADAWMYVTRR